MKEHLSRFENLARRVIEGSFSRLLGERLEALDLAARMARAMDENRLNTQAPDVYYLTLNPEDYATLLAESPQVAAELSDAVAQLARQAGLSLVGWPEVQLAVDPALRRQQVRVSASHSAPAEPQTAVLQVPPDIHAMQVEIEAVDAFLIVEGRRHVPLRQPLTTLGRRTDNDVVLEAPSVSRRHAQIRYRFGRFILYDVGGRGRTLVNGQPVTECPLQPGDVIGLSDTLLIYGEGRDGQPGAQAQSEDGQGGTLLMPPATDE